MFYLSADDGNTNTEELVTFTIFAFSGFEKNLRVRSNVLIGKATQVLANR